MVCGVCQGRHHVSICQRTSVTTQSSQPPGNSGSNTGNSATGVSRAPHDTTNLHINSQTPILLQTAQVVIQKPNKGHVKTPARAILDLGSQRTYVTEGLRGTLGLLTLSQEVIAFKTFGSNEQHVRECDVVEVGLKTKNGSVVIISALTVPFIVSH